MPLLPTPLGSRRAQGLRARLSDRTILSMLAADPPTPQVLAISRGIQSPQPPIYVLGQHTFQSQVCLLPRALTPGWVSGSQGPSFISELGEGPSPAGLPSLVITAIALAGALSPGSTGPWAPGPTMPGIGRVCLPSRCHVPGWDPLVPCWGSMGALPAPAPVLCPMTWALPLVSSCLLPCQP